MVPRHYPPDLIQRILILIQGSGEGQSASVDAEGAGKATDVAREDAAQTEGESRERQKKSANERKMTPSMPRDKQLVTGKRVNNV